nr:calnexin homolog [Tanacetum cinerariifolium]
MDECKRKMCCLHLFGLVLIGCFAFEIYASSSGTIFYDSFDESFERNWIVSENADYLG